MMSSVTGQEDHTDDEFTIDHTAAKDETVNLKRLKEFAYYLVENIEFNLNFCLQLLEERQTPAKTNGIHVTILSKLSSLIPKVGAGIGSALSFGELRILQKIDKSNSRKLADLVYYFSDNREAFRRVLVEGAVDVFASFEAQFEKLTCNGGEKRAMQKLAIDAADRVYNYFLDTEQTRAVSKTEITKGVIFGNSKRNRAGVRQGKGVQKDETKWKTDKMYRKVGIVILEENLFYKNEATNTKKYGHRRPFAWEDPVEIKKNWQQDDNHDIPNYTLKPSETIIQDIINYIMTKNPYEEAKLERSTYHEESSKDRAEKYQELLVKLREHFKETLDAVEEYFHETKTSTTETKELLVNVTKKQDLGNSTQLEIVTKLETIHSDVLVTKEAQIVTSQTSEEIKSEIVVIRKNQEELATAVVKTEDLEKIVKTQSKEGVKDNLNEVVREVLRGNDPGPSLKKEAQRVGHKVQRELKRFLKRV